MDIKKSDYKIIQNTDLSNNELLNVKGIIGPQYLGKSKDINIQTYQDGDNAGNINIKVGNGNANNGNIELINNTSNLKVCPDKIDLTGDKTVIETVKTEIGGLNKEVVITGGVNSTDSTKPSLNINVNNTGSDIEVDNLKATNLTAKDGNITNNLNVDNRLTTKELVVKGEESEKNLKIYISGNSLIFEAVGV